MTTEMKLFDHLELPYKDGGDDWLITCPWCASEKMSVGKSEGNIYQCWKCKESGNALTLTRKFYEDLPALSPPSAKEFLSRKKGVSFQTLRSEGVRYEGGYYWFPVQNADGKLIALHKYNPQNNIAYSSPKPWNCSILGLNQLEGHNELWIAEGHADYLVMRSVLKGQPIDLLGTCGSSFSQSYLHLLDGKSVVLLFDNDEAGRNGVQSVARRLKASGNSVESLKCIDWSRLTIPSGDIPDKFDIRDLWNELRAT